MDSVHFVIMHVFVVVFFFPFFHIVILFLQLIIYRCFYIIFFFITVEIIHFMQTYDFLVWWIN